MLKHEAYKSHPGGVGNIGRLGEGIDPDWAAVHGGRALRRLLARDKQRQATKATVNAQKRRKSQGSRK
jgi:transcription initiation factor TFIID subunit TAF12